MKKIIIENDFWSLFKDAKIGVVVCNNIDNHIKDKNKYESMLLEAQKQAMNYLTEEDFSNNKVIKVWRDAFKKFKTKKGARCSIEAMLKRVSNGNNIGNINPLVDIYNSVSLKYGLPCGGEDIDTFDGDIRLTRANGEEEFITFGSDENIPPYEGEVVYKDNKGAICRCLNWRESTRTMLTEKTQNALLCIELIDESRINEFEEALQFLADTITENLGGKSKVAILDNSNREMIIQV